VEEFPGHGLCFVCGSENPHGIGIRWYAKEDNSIFAEIALNKYQQGAPGIAHGGATAAILDEGMGFAAWQAGHRVLAKKIEIIYHRPVPLGVNIQINGEVAEEDGRKIYTHGEIRLPDGEIAVEGRGLYVEAGQVLSDLFEKHTGNSH
jgi:acyl-coenzyme A thioesterase PaaI-like protein